MARFGKTLFGDSRFVRWALSPFLLMFAVLMPGLVESRTPQAIAVLIMVELMCVCLLAGFWLPSRFGRWAFRILAGVVFLTYAGYLVYEFGFDDAPFKLLESEGEASPRNALLGFVIIGLPCLWFALFGRFTRKPPQPELADDEADSWSEGEANGR